MADDLKPMLTRVLASAGRKKFHFAYGTGKRKDGKGDGALVVDRNKLKPEEAEDGLEKAGQTFAGTCWSGPDGETVYFAGQGKKLSPMIVAKMALTAKRQAGKQYDFRVPTPEEEAQAEKLAEGEATPEEVPQAPPAPPPAPPTAGDATARFKARVTKATAQLKALKSSDPGRAQALAGLLAQAASLAQMKPPQYADAELRLDEFDKQLEALWTGPAAGSPPPPPPPRLLTAPPWSPRRPGRPRPGP